MSKKKLNLTEHLSKAADTFLANWEVLHANYPDFLWHYTAIGGVRGIADNGELWFSDATFLNDYLEMSYAVDLLAEVVDESLKGNISTDAREFLTRTVGGIKTNREDSKIFGFVDTAFVVCFCEKGDSLHLWRAYTGNGRGYSFGFFPNSILHRLKSVLVTSNKYERTYKPILRKIIYERSEQIDHLKNLVAIFVEAIDDYVKQGGSINEIHVFSRGFYRAFFDCLCSFKHPSFSEEHEWRIIYLPTHEPEKKKSKKSITSKEVKYRESNGYLVPYITVDIATDDKTGKVRLPFENLIIGPSLDEDLAKRSIHSFFYRKPNYLGSVLVVEKSQVPLR